YLLALPTGTLAGTKLVDVLEWPRWGSATGCMWECTLPEMIRLIEKWLLDNPDGTLKNFGISQPSPDFTWQELWETRGSKGGYRRARKCSCRKIHEEFAHCDACGQAWYDMQQTTLTVRGPETYNVILEGADGGSIAAAVWNGRNWLLLEPL